MRSSAAAFSREVVCAFWKEEPSFRQVLDMVESPEVYIVPNFISEGYFTQKIIPRELGLDGSVTHLPPRPGLPARTLKYCEPVGNHPWMTQLLLHRAREVAPGVDPARAPRSSSSATAPRSMKTPASP